MASSIRRALEYARKPALITGAILAVFVVWEVLEYLGIIEPTLVPRPVAVVDRLVSLLFSGSILPDLGATIARMFVGYLAACVMGILFGLSIGYFRPLYDGASGVIDFFRSIPVTTLYPVFVLVFGIGHLSKIAMVFWSSFFVIALNSAYGVTQSRPLRTQMAKLYGASQGQVFRWITLFDALPQTMIGLRVAISYAVIVEVLCEMFMGSESGLGQRVTEAFTRYNVAELYAVILLTGCFGYSLNRLFVVVERRVVPWVSK